MGEEPHKTYQELWEQYMEVERRELEQRRNGQLGRALGRALPGESQEELQRIAKEDQRKAERGLVELCSGDEVWYKHIDEITRDDRPARIESKNARAAWIQERLRRQPRPQ
jgi:lauroyl/myristoyl acyltransferase